MRLLTAAVTFTANCNSCHKIFHEILYTQRTHTTHTPHTPHLPPNWHAKQRKLLQIITRAWNFKKDFPTITTKLCVFSSVDSRCCCGSWFRPIIVCLFSNSIISIGCDSLLEMPISIAIVRIKLNELILFLFAYPMLVGAKGILILCQRKQKPLKETKNPFFVCMNS